MFNLEKAIINWKSKLNENNTLTSDDLDELQSHLLDEIDSLRLKNLTDEESFLVACNRLGSFEAICSEFEKVNLKAIWLNKLVFLLLGISFFYFAQGLIQSLSFSMVTFAEKSNIISQGNLSIAVFVVEVFIATIFLFSITSSRFASIIGKLNSSKKSIIYFILGLFTLMNSIGFSLLRIPFSNLLHASLFGEMYMGHSYFTILWIISLFALLMLLQRKKYVNIKSSIQISK